MDRFQERKENQGVLVGGTHMKWVAIIFSIVFALGFLFVAMAVVAALFASAGYDVMEDELNKKRQESISKTTTNKRK